MQTSSPQGENWHIRERAEVVSFSLMHQISPCRVLAFFFLTKLGNELYFPLASLQWYSLVYQPHSARNVNQAKKSWTSRLLISRYCVSPSLDRPNSYHVTSCVDTVCGGTGHSRLGASIGNGIVGCPIEVHHPSCACEVDGKSIRTGP